MRLDRSVRTPVRALMLLQYNISGIAPSELFYPAAYQRNEVATDTGQFDRFRVIFRGHHLLLRFTRLKPHHHRGSESCRAMQMRNAQSMKYICDIAVRQAGRRLSENRITRELLANYLAAMLPTGSARRLSRSLMSRSVSRLVSMASTGISRSTSDAMASRKPSRSSTS